MIGYRPTHAFGCLLYSRGDRKCRTWPGEKLSCPGVLPFLLFYPGLIFVPSFSSPALSIADGLASSWYILCAPCLRRTWVDSAQRHLNISSWTGCIIDPNRLSRFLGSTLYFDECLKQNVRHNIPIVNMRVDVVRAFLVCHGFIFRPKTGAAACDGDIAHEGRSRPWSRIGVIDVVATLISVASSFQCAIRPPT